MDNKHSEKTQLRHFNRFFLQLIVSVTCLHTAIAAVVAYKVYYFPV